MRADPVLRYGARSDSPNNFLTMKNLNTHPGIHPEKDKLYGSKNSDVYKRRADAIKHLSDIEYEIKQLHRLDGESRGLEAASIGRVDLVEIIEDLLASKSPVSKAFQRHEVSKSKCTDWAKRTIKYSVNETELRSALDTLANNTDLILINKYDVLDISDILRPASYSAALTKLKKQLVIANRFQDKDNELINKDIAIADKDAKIEELMEELVRNKSIDWQQQALKLRQAGTPVTKIALLLSIGRTTVSSYLNSPGVKSQIPKATK